MRVSQVTIGLRLLNYKRLLKNYAKSIILMGMIQDTDRKGSICRYVIGLPGGKRWILEELQTIYWDTISKNATRQNFE